MILYEFITEDGMPRELFFEHEDVPSIGEWVEHEGERLRRVASGDGQIKVSIDPHFVAESINAGHPAIDACELERREDGQPKFANRAQIEKFCDVSRAMQDKDPTVQGYGYD